jgi:hypothetical protein
MEKFKTTFENGQKVVKVLKGIVHFTLLSTAAETKSFSYL